MASGAFVSFASAHVAHRLNVPWEMNTRSKAGDCVCSAPHRYAELERADERTRTADLLITSDYSALQEFAGACKSPYLSRFLFPLPCSVLHRIAFPVVSEWCQYHPRIHLRARAPFARPLAPPPSRGTLNSTLVPAPGLASRCMLSPSTLALSIVEHRPSRVA